MVLLIIVFRELMELLRAKGSKLSGALPQEAVPTNVIRHILKQIREEYFAKVKVCCRTKLG